MAKNVSTNILRNISAKSSIFDDPDETHILAYTGVPEFVQKAQKSFQTIIINVRNKEDLEKLSVLLKMPNLMLPGKRSNKSFWYPELEYGERGQNSLCVWMDEDNVEVKKLIDETK